MWFRLQDQRPPIRLDNFEILAEEDIYALSLSETFAHCFVTPT